MLVDCPHRFTKERAAEGGQVDLGSAIPSGNLGRADEGRVHTSGVVFHPCNLSFGRSNFRGGVKKTSPCE
jgi:hypothetical protein